MTTLMLSLTLVLFTWTPSTSPNVTSQTLACGLSRGGPYPITKSFKPTTKAFASGMTKGTHYCIITATSSAGTSKPSNEIKTVVP